MNNILTCNCPNCSGSIEYSVNESEIKCKYCNTVFNPGDLNLNIPHNSNHDHNSKDVVSTEGFIRNEAPWNEVVENRIKRYSCPSCGAKLIADRSSITTTCPFCSNNLIVEGVTTDKTLPDKLIQFSVTEEEVLEKIRNHSKGLWYAPFRFEPVIDNIRPVFVPYYKYDLIVHGVGKFYGGYEENKINLNSGRDYYLDYIEKNNKLGLIEATSFSSQFEDNKNMRVSYCRAIYCECDMISDDIIIDGSSKMLDEYMKGLYPFNCEEAVNFDASNIAGIYAESPDQSSETCKNKIKKSINNTCEKKLAKEVVRQDNISCIEKVESMKLDYEFKNAEIYCMPVWLASYKYEGEDRLFAVNGQTGKCVGSLPVSTPKRTLTIVALIAFFAMMVLLSLRMMLPLMSLMFFGAAFVTISPIDNNLVDQLDNTIPHYKPAINTELKVDVKRKTCSEYTRVVVNNNYEDLKEDLDEIS